MTEGKETKKLKCNICKKKISIIEEIMAKCKCNNYYCTLHRLPENHNCEFDYIANNKSILEKKLIKPDTNKNLVILG